MKMIILILFIVQCSFAQVGINTNSPKALLDIAVKNPNNPTNKDGLLIPRVSSFSYNFPIANQKLILVYNTTLKGFYFLWYFPTWKNITGLQTEYLSDLDDVSSNNADNLFLGKQLNATGNERLGIGYFNNSNDYSVSAGYLNSGGSSSVYLGYQSNGLNQSNSGYTIYTTAVGFKTVNEIILNAISPRYPKHDIALGSQALLSTSEGSYNIAVGYQTLKKVFPAFSPVDSHLIGFGSGAISSSTGTVGPAIGFGANSLANLSSDNSSGYKNDIALGYQCLYNINIDDVNESHNIGIGLKTFFSKTSGRYSIAIGSKSMEFSPVVWQSVIIGGATNPVNANRSNNVIIGDATTSTADGQARFGDSGVSSIGGFANWTNVSDKRFKKEIKEDVVGISFIKKLRPVSYQLNTTTLNKFLNLSSDAIKETSQNRKAQEIQNGFLAQEVEKAANETHFNFNGIKKPKNEDDVYGLRYASFVVPLVKAIQEQQKTLNQQQERIKALKTKLKELDKLLNEADYFIAKKQTIKKK
ncbi:MAG: tail fiber domain-containing protein [Flavobacteriales bacterium]